jgi:hypothetical protein
LQRYSRAELNQLKKDVAASPSDGGKERTDQQLAAAQSRAMFRSVLKKQPLDPAQLKDLAGRRASATSKVLTSEYGLAADRLVLSPPVERPPSEDMKVPSVLSLTTDG